MALRTLVTGSDMCSAGDAGAGPSNAVGALVNQLLGGAGKTQETLRDVRGAPLTLRRGAVAAAGFACSGVRQRRGCRLLLALSLKA